ncbi:MAG: murein L,D-transpeptidase family protein [Luteolibacter sp.]
MKAVFIICALCWGSLASCEEKKTKEPTMSEKSSLSGKDRAAVAAARVRPNLEHDLSALGLRYGDPIFIRVFKDSLVLELFVRNRTTAKFDRFRTYPIACASGVLGPKLAEGDMQVPEGFYFVPPAAMNPNSNYHLSFNVGYPNAYDQAHHRTGSAIMVHGNCVSIGCLAMTDEKIDEIYTLCAAAHAGGQPFFHVNIFPFRMTEERMRASAGDPNEDFWKNLKDGYDLFEKSHTPPEVSVENGKYVFKMK